MIATQAPYRLAPQGTQIRKIAFVSRTDRENTISVEQLPTGLFRMPLATMINLWDIYGHMARRTYPTIEAFLDDAAEGWKTWREYTPLPALTNEQETAIVKQALQQAGIRPKSVRHHFGPVIIIMGRSEAHEGEFLQIEMLAWEALDGVRTARNCCSGIHVVDSWRGKLAAGYDRFRRCKR
jgi:hypothetical protein